MITSQVHGGKCSQARCMVGSDHKPGAWWELITRQVHGGKCSQARCMVGIDHKAVGSDHKAGAWWEVITTLLVNAAGLQIN